MATKKQVYDAFMDGACLVLNMNSEFGMGDGGCEPLEYEDVREYVMRDPVRFPSLARWIEGIEAARDE